MYRIHGTWYRMLPNPVNSVPPLPLQQIANSKWNYVDPQNLANGGIYSAEDVEKLNEHIMFPVEKVRKDIRGRHNTNAQSARRADSAENRREHDEEDLEWIHKIRIRIRRSHGNLCRMEDHQDDHQHHPERHRPTQGVRLEHPPPSSRMDITDPILHFPRRQE